MKVNMYAEFCFDTVATSKIFQHTMHNNTSEKTRPKTHTQTKKNKKPPSLRVECEGWSFWIEGKVALPGFIKIR